MNDRKETILALSLTYAKIIAKMDELKATDEEWNYANQLADKIKYPNTVGIYDAFTFQLEQSSQINETMVNLLNMKPNLNRTNGLVSFTYQIGDRMLEFIEKMPDGSMKERTTTDRHLFEIMAVMDLVSFDVDDVMVMVFHPESINCPVLKLKQWVIDEPVQGVKEIRQMEDARCLKQAFEMASKKDGQ